MKQEKEKKNVTLPRRGCKSGGSNRPINSQDVDPYQEQFQTMIIRDLQTFK